LLAHPDQDGTPGGIKRVMVDISDKAFEELSAEAKPARAKVAMGMQ
jgi:hypothetical protein